MTLHERNFETIPAQTVAIAQKAFPKGNVYVNLRDSLGVVYRDEQFAELFCSSCGQSAYSPGQLALVTVMQFMEGLSDQQAAEAVRSRIDWKYALGLELSDEGFDRSVLSEFRGRLIAGDKVEHLLDELLRQAQARGWVKARGKQRSDSTHVLAAVRHLNRLELVGETLRHSLNVLATVVPEWLVQQVDAGWFERYSERVEQSRVAKSKAEQQAWVMQVGKDGHQLLAAIEAAEQQGWLRQIPAVEMLRQVWVQQYYLDAQGVHWRDGEGLPPNSQLIQSPYDPQARNRTKREMNWTGYMVHLSETCEEDGVNLITHVITTPATTADSQVTPDIHAALSAKDLAPQEHFVDQAYAQAEHRVSAQAAGIELVAPAALDTNWQAQAPERFDRTCFTIDWSHQVVRCPMGQDSIRWTPTTHSRGHPIIRVSFSARHCTPCPSRHLCTQAKANPRILHLLPEAQHLARSVAQQQQTTPAFKQRYARRAGIEGTLSQAVRAFDLRRTRYLGLAKTHLQNVAIATAINLTRLAAYFNLIPKAQTRVSHFAALSSFFSG
jgi:transposase